MFPQGAVGGWTPSPRKLLYASDRIALATPRVAETIIGAMLFGNICLNMIPAFEVPVDLAASTKSFSLRDKNSALTIRARYIQLVNPMIIIITIKLPLNFLPRNGGR